MFKYVSYIATDVPTLKVTVLKAFAGLVLIYVQLYLPTRQIVRQFFHIDLAIKNPGRGARVLLSLYQLQLAAVAK